MNENKDVWLTKFPIEITLEPTICVMWDEFGMFNLIGESFPSEKQLDDLYAEQKIKMAEAEKVRGDVLIRECEFNLKMEKSAKRYKFTERVVMGLLFLLLYLGIIL